VNIPEFEEELRRLWVKAQTRRLRREIYTALAIASVSVLGLAVLGAWIILRR
jgi:hypothetical protein